MSNLTQIKAGEELIDGAATTIQTGFNLVKILKRDNLSMEDQAKWAKHLFLSGYSGVKNKKALSTTVKTITANNVSWIRR